MITKDIPRHCVAKWLDTETGEEVGYVMPEELGTTPPAQEPSCSECHVAGAHKMDCSHRCGQPVEPVKQEPWAYVDKESLKYIADGCDDVNAFIAKIKNPTNCYAVYLEPPPPASREQVKALESRITSQALHCQNLQGIVTARNAEIARLKREPFASADSRTLMGCRDAANALIDALHAGHNDDLLASTWDQACLIFGRYDWQAQAPVLATDGLVRELRDRIDAIAASAEEWQDRAEKAEAELSTEKALREDLSKQIKEAWDACPVSGAIRGMTTLADVVQIAYETRDSTIAEMKAKIESGEFTKAAADAIAMLGDAQAEAYNERTRADQLEKQLAARPVAVPPDVQDVVDAVGKYTAAYDIDESTAMESEAVRDVYRALSTAPYRCVQGWAHPTELDPGTNGCLVHYQKRPDPSFVPVTLCWTEAPKGGGK